MFKVLKSGKRQKKSWKRMITKVCMLMALSDGPSQNLGGGV
jgi:hypothetical protein